MPQWATITAYPRVHIGLLDMAGVTPRQYGGVGFFINALTTMVRAAPADTMELRLPDNIEPRTVEQLNDAASRLAERGCTPCLAELMRGPKSHVGLGSKSTLVLSVLTAMSLVGDAALSRTELQKMSGRGAASGIGVNGFFTGGWIWDGGQPTPFRQPTKAPFSPSAYGTPREIPPVLVDASMPSDWRVALIIPHGRAMSGPAEREFFESWTPIEAAKATESIALAYHGILPAVRTADLSALRSSLYAFQRTGFKEIEIEAQSSSVRACLAELESETPYPCGMSSLGPLLYVLHDDTDAQDPVFHRIAANHEADFLGSFVGRNQGYDLQLAQDQTPHG